MTLTPRLPRRAFFLRHEGYLGAIGAWIKHLDDMPASMPGTPAQRQSRPPSQLLTSPGVNGERDDVVPPPTSPSPPLPSGAMPGRSMEASGLLPTPIVEAPEPLAAAAVAPAASGVVRPPNASEERGVNGATGQDGGDLLSMLQSLQVEHRQLVEPVVEAQAQGEAQEPEGEESIQELLRKLDEADGAADGLESKLDSLLGRLDGILSSSEIEAEMREHVGR